MNAANRSSAVYRNSATPEEQKNPPHRKAIMFPFIQQHGRKAHFLRMTRVFAHSGSCYAKLLKVVLIPYIINMLQQTRVFGEPILILSWQNEEKSSQPSGAHASILGLGALPLATCGGQMSTSFLTGPEVHSSRGTIWGREVCQSLIKPDDLLLFTGSFGDV